MRKQWRYFVLAIFAIAYLVLRRIVSSGFGTVLIATVLSLKV